MKPSDFQIHDTEKLDTILIELCQLIIEGQKENSNHYGMVAACVLDNDNNIVKSTSYRRNNKYVHAERAAIDKYLDEVGPLQAGSIIVTTLSPCSRQMDDRYSESCTTLINESPIKKVYSGYSDPTQDNSERYKHKRFHIQTTRNKKIEYVCKEFADTFLKETINEVNPDTLAGSEGPGLHESRLFVLDKLKDIQNKFDTIYILGSWYGNLSIMIEQDTDIGYDKIINVDIDKEKILTSEKIIKNLGYDFIEFMNVDANELDYRQLGQNGLVIGQSCNNIENDEWFNNIPEGTMVALTARNNDSKAVNQFDSTFDLAERYTLKNILYAGKDTFTDPETSYETYVIIGIK